ncbi:MAG: glycerate kinase, partial [Oscillospiraceae bacterium]|nr:glycerate kinase [Oscillospiraceae bacterium]
AAASITADRLGYKPLILTTTLDCEAREAGAAIAAIAREIHKNRRPVTPPCAVILGGETVVRVHGSGLGGRNQELALAASKGIDGLPGTVLFSVGSDGTDGPTDAAGGIVTGEFARQCREASVSIDAYLSDNDAYHILQRMGGLITTGPTGTNVNDLTVLLIR